MVFWRATGANRGREGSRQQQREGDRHAQTATQADSNRDREGGKVADSRDREGDRQQRQ